MITPVQFLIQYPITAKTIPNKRKCAVNSGDIWLVENERFSKVTIAYSIFFETPLI
jgi:hypothetical protein